MVYFTSIITNYLPKARILARSVKEHNPDSKFYVVLSDKVPEDFDLNKEPFDGVVRIEELNLPTDNLLQWIFMHTVTELCTAVKGQVFLNLLDNGAEKVIYLDPDIVVLDSLNELNELLDTQHIILTPHQTEPEDSLDAIIDNEICSLKHGVYNLGFLAVRNTDEAKRFVQWWRDRLLLFCYSNIPGGIFTDQRWIDLAPAFFDGVYIEKDKRYNIATWNLTNRKVYSSNGRLMIDGRPVVFYHFSGFDSGDQEVMLKKYDSSNKALFDLREWYISQMEQNGQSVLGKAPCVYDFYSNGEKILPEHRVLYRNRGDLQRAFPNPDLDYLAWLKVSWPKEKENNVNELITINHDIENIMNSKTWKTVVFLRKIIERAGRLFGVTFN
jgi:lipopolysaccharide biosynthesis glycosyltransferase